MTAMVALRRVALGALLVMVVLGVGDRDAPAAERLPVLDVLVAVDTTTSMSALDDPAGSRITAVRRDLVALGQQLESARFTLVTAGGVAEVQLPATSDRVAFEEAVTNLQVVAADAGARSSVDTFVPLVDRLLERAEAEPDRLPVLVYAGDGENTGDWDISVLDRLQGRLRAAAVVGYGTEDGGVMPLVRVAPGDPPPTAEQAGVLVPDVRTGQPAVSRASPETLRAVAERVGATYVGDGSHDMAEVATELQRAAYADLEPVEAARQLGWVWGLLLFALGLPELRRGAREWAAARREVRR